MIAFRAWLTTQTGRTDRVGDIALEMESDHCAAYTESINCLQAHLMFRHSAEVGALNALDAAFREYQQQALGFRPFPRKR